MSNKRTATSELNHDNWNVEEAPEEMGTYKRATDLELKQRTMKKARRRGVTTGEIEGPSVFKNFKGFGAADSSAAPTFSFLNNDGEKPKLSIGGSFPSFSFTKSPESSKSEESKNGNSVNSSASSEKPTSVFASAFPTTLKSNTSKNENENSSKPVFAFSVTDTNKDTNSAESSPKAAFSFGISTASKSTDKPVSTFVFSPSRKEGIDSVENETSKPIFKFGVVDTNKNATSIESSPKSTFSFGVNTSNKNKDKGVLSSFNFNPSKPAGDSPSTFKFGVNASVDTKVNLSSSSVTTPQIKPSSDNTNSKNKEPQSSKVNGISDTPKTEKKRNTLFLANLKALNLGVIKWVQQHLDKNQYINLIPIFEDYKSHFEDIKKRFDHDDAQPTKSNKNNSSNQEKESSSTSKNNSGTSLFSFGSSSTAGSKSDPFPTGSPSNAQKTDNVDKTNEKEKTFPEQKLFSFGLNKTATEKSETSSDSNNKSTGLFNFGNSTSSPAFSFGSDNKDKPSFNFGSVDSGSSSKTSDFSFGLSKTAGFSFATTPVITETKPEESKDEDEVQEEEQMPEIKEEGSVYEKKAKLFHKKNNQYDTIGVGTLYIKPVKESDKSQLIVRADNSLGTVLLNILLNDSIPTQRVGKNNVLIVCVPNPPLERKATQTPASILIRVKTGDDADELLEKLNHYKQLNKTGDVGKESD